MSPEAKGYVRKLALRLHKDPAKVTASELDKLINFALIETGGKP